LSEYKYTLEGFGLGEDSFLINLGGLGQIAAGSEILVGNLLLVLAVCWLLWEK